MNKKTENFNFSKAIKQLEDINEWFNNDQIDLQQGLEKLKEGKDLIIECKKVLVKVENEFIDIKKQLQDIEDTNELPSFN